MNFKELAKTDVTKHIAKKGKYSYLSWPYAVEEFRKACPNGIWQVRSFGDNNQPYCQTGAGCFVEVEVWPNINGVEGAHPASQISFTQVHPVLDYQNKVVKEPDAYQVNTSIQRCLVKAIALATGIGLFIYAGEDLPPSDEKPPVDKKPEDDGKKSIEKYELELEAAFNEGIGEKWWKDNHKQAKKDWPKDFELTLVQLKDVLKLKASKKDVGTHIGPREDLPL